MQNKEENVKEVEISAMLSLVFRKAIPILIVALLAALCLGIFQVRKQNKLVANSKAALSSDEYVQLTEDYENAKLDYERQLHSLELELEKTEQQQSQSQAYLENSLKLALDPLDHYVTTAFLSIVDVDESAMEEKLGDSTDLRDYLYGKLVDRYVMLFSGLDLSQDLGLEAYRESKDSYVRELVDVRNYGNGSICVTVSEATEDASMQLAEAIVHYLLQQNAAVAKALYAHNLVLDSIVAKNVVDDELAESQQDKYDAAHQSKDRVEELKDSIELLEEPDEADYQGTMTLRTFSKSAVIKYAVIGFLAGAVVAACYVMAEVVLGRRYMTGYEIEKAVGAGCLGSVGKNGIFAQIAASVAHDRRWNGKTAKAYLTAKSAELLQGKESVLVASSVKLSGRETKALKEALGSGAEKTLKIVDSFNENPDAVTDLPDCGCVILAERIAGSDERKLGSELDALRKAGKEILGFVTV